MSSGRILSVASGSISMFFPFSYVPCTLLSYNEAEKQQICVLIE